MILRSPFHIDSPLVLSEFMSPHEQPLAEIHRAILQYLQNRSDVVVFGAQAVNMYVAPPRMTEDIDLMSPAAELLAEEIRVFIHETFQIAARVRSVASGKGFRVYQLRSPSNRHLVGIRQVDVFPNFQTIEGLAIVQPADLIALKVISSSLRAGTPKGFTDQADLMRLLLAFPQYKTSEGEVSDAMQLLGAEELAYKTWQHWVESELRPDQDDY